MNLAQWEEKVRGLDGTTYPGNTTAAVINKPSFEAAKDAELDFIMEVEKASFTMLCETGLLRREDRAPLAAALMSFPYDEVRSRPYDRNYAEDMFFAVERVLTESAGRCASNLHLGRSRNDMLRTVNKMLIRKSLVALHERLEDLADVLIALAREHVDTLMPGYTHTQQAQPTTLAHYLSGMLHVLERDMGRLQKAVGTMQLCPMGAGALTTTSFSIDRQTLCSLLGFERVMENSYDAVCSSDFLTEPAAVMSVLCGDIGRFVMHLHVWSAQEYGFLKHSRAYVGISSMMPQKRNPSTVEHIRARLSECEGECFAVQLMNHNCEFEGNIDICCAPRRLCAIAQEISEAVLLLTHILATLEVDRRLLRERVMNSFTVMTDLADLLVREEKLDYRSAHSVASRLVDLCTAKGKTLREVDGSLIGNAFASVTGRSLRLDFSKIQVALNAENSVSSHAVSGGPSVQSVCSMLDGSTQRLEKDREWLRALNEKLELSHIRLERRVGSYLHAEA